MNNGVTATVECWGFVWNKVEDSGKGSGTEVFSIESDILEEGGGKKTGFGEREVKQRT